MDKDRESATCESARGNDGNEIGDVVPLVPLTKAKQFIKMLFMPRGPRLDTPGALHHVMVRGLEKREIFLSDADRNDLLKRLGEVIPKSGAHIFAWSLLPNHFHLLIRTGSLPLSSVMRKILTGYSIAFNRRHSRVGHLFQNRYKSILVEEEPYLLELVRYIHLNPLRTNIVKDLSQLDNFAWSGHCAILGKMEYPWQDCQYILAHFGKTVGKGRRAYRDFVKEGIEQGKRFDLTGGGLRRSMGDLKEVEELLRGREKWSFDERILGGSDFVQSVLSETEKEKGGRADPRKLKLGGIQEIVQKVRLKLGLSGNEVTGGSRRKCVVHARDIVSYITVRKYGMSLTEVARQLGVSKQSVLRGVERGEGELKNRGWVIADFA